MKAAFFSFALCLLAAVLVSPARAQDVYKYEVRPGDTIYDLAQKYFQQSSDYKDVVRLNQVHDPKLLKPGAVLEIPREYLRFTRIQARVIAFRGSVYFQPRGRARMQAELGLPVGEGAVVETAAKSYITIATQEGMRTTLPSQSKVRIVRLRQYWIDGFIERKFALLKGRSEWDVESMRSDLGGDLIITTPTSTSAIRGTNFRVGLSKANVQNATVTVLKGSVAVSSLATAGQKSVLVEAGFGVAADQLSISTPRRLLNSPSLLNPEKIQNEDILQFEVAPLVGASAYRFRLATDAGMLDVIAEETSTVTAAQFDAPTPGQYYLEVSAIDGGGLEGMPRVYEFRRQEAGVSRISARYQEEYRRTYFSWHTNGNVGPLRFILSQERDLSNPLVDKVGVEEGQMIISDLEPGKYFWTVQEIRIKNGDLKIIDRPIAELVIAER